MSKRNKRKKRRKRRKTFKHKFQISKVIITICLAIFISLIIVFGYKTLINQNENDKINDNHKEEIKKEEDKEEVYKASMIMAGDNLIHSTIYKDANEIANGGVRNLNTNAFDFTGMYELIKPIVSMYDIAYYNQETILGGTEIGLSDYPTFNSPYEVGDAMIDAGFNLVSLATNHTMDKGSKAALNSREYWNNKESVLAVGSYSSFEDRDEIDIREVNNISYTMLNYTYGTNGMPVPNGKEYLVNVWPTDIDNINNPDTDTEYQEYKTQVKEDIERVRDKVDVLIVAMHWGVEYTHEPTNYEKDMANYLASLDVDVIVGTHPHVIQPIEWIDDTLVIYSLGNLLSAQYQNRSTCTNYKCMVGLLSSFEITKTVKNDESEITINNIDNELIYTYYNQSTWRGYKVVPFSDESIKTYLSDYQNVYTKYKEVVQRYDNTIHVVDAYEYEG